MQDKSNRNSGEDEGDNVEPDQSVEANLSLREAREAHGISIDEVAHQLHLSSEVVLALEAGDYEALGAPVFVRGHLRSYARLVDLPEEEVVAGYQPYEPEPEEFRTLSAHTVVKPGASLPNFVLWALLVLVLLVGAGYLLLGDEETAANRSGIGNQSADFSEPRVIEEEEMPVVVPDDEPVTESAPAEADISAAVEMVSPDRSSFEVIADDAGASENVVEENREQAVREEPAVIEQPAADKVAPAILTLRFNEECWVEISDSKRRLLYGLEKSGTEVDLEGTPPFKLFIGNIGVVDIEVAGRPFTVPQSGLRGGNTARFSIAKDNFR